MCNKTKKVPRSQTSVLLSSSSFHCSDEKGEKLVAPSKKSALLTVACYVLFISINEHIIRFFMNQPFVISIDPIFEDERNRLILSRHFAIDAFSCLVCAVLGWKSRQYLSSSNMLTFKRNDPDTNSPQALDKSLHCDFHKRLYSYNPYGHQIMLMFFAYQVRNMYDTIVWKDGWLFVAHHIFAGASAWMAMYPDSNKHHISLANQYAIFYFGVSEISTFVLCLLANFEPDLGVKGLEDVFPMTRIVLAGTFVVLFILCRMVLWNVITYNYLLDIGLALKRKSPAFETPSVKTNLRFFQFSLSFMTLLQVIWMWEIIVMGKEEIAMLLAK
ncbi:hypothetical protein CTEN210_04209 [Chaetoceros tenuissimus]|uniref:TLC domain-containing protein n=1 Tax=Chaetoceros tenuissimus TaxID=426638 RepID=A0AAD3H2Q7_9STRA|nr:hypothetical protein CTEN210_04209 [Chaetoceros tenuissimus]